MDKGWGGLGFYDSTALLMEEDAVESQGVVQGGGAMLIPNESGF